MAALLFGLGALVRFGKASWLIAGYNTASRKEKEKYDREKLCRYTGNLIFILAAIWTVLSILLLAFGDNGTVITAGIFVFVGAAVGGVIFLNTGGRLKKDF